jgi:hypothetical protein
MFCLIVGMPRTYERKPGARRYVDYTEQNVLDAIEAVKKGSLKSHAAREYKVPLRTLYEKLRASESNTLKMIRKPGGQPVFNQCEEKRFCDNLLACSDFGFPIHRDDLRAIITTYLTESKRTVRGFKDGVVPGIDWVYGFEKRHPEISFRFAQNITSDRAKVNEEVGSICILKGRFV